MEISKALELLKEYLGELEHLRTLHHGNEERWLWKNKVDVVLEAAFGKTSWEYWELNPPIVITEDNLIDEARPSAYLANLGKYELGIKKILQKYEILKVETKPTAAVEPAEGPKEYEERQGKQPLGKEIRRQLSGTPEEVAPHIIRVAREFQFQGFSYDAREERITSNKFSKQITIYRVTSWLDVDEFWATGGQGLPHEVLPHIVGGILLQSLPDNKTLFIAKHTSSSFDSNGSYLDSFLEMLSLEFKKLGIEETKAQKTWRWFNRIIELWNKLKP